MDWPNAVEPAPIVLMMRQPPVAVPRLMAVALMMITHRGTANSCWNPRITRDMVITPMVF